ncbi:hypothetical protein DLJ82_6673 (plasmid) [Rhizobium leguminosarum]|uniref:Outer membrane protein beta-barrel domain-containing protein n=1 Tax=Rhizobium leguminosarum TaxID=384 RepID=A0A2Z4YX60_RHILE|nr:hypothetical protein DLJ82_6673 [Rhizobium leguminosarum]
MATAEARYDRYSIVGDVIYVKLGADAHTHRGIFADSVDVTSETFAGLLGVGYAVLEDQNGHLGVWRAAAVADVDWDVGLGLGYKFNDTISAVVGYRALGVNYESDEFVFDVVQQGPIIGVSFHF